MSRVVTTERAYLDLEEIRDYISLRNEDAADRLLREIQRKCDSTATVPLSGRSREEHGANIRSFPVGNYIVYYVPIADGIEIRRVLHGARDVDELEF